MNQHTPGPWKRAGQKLIVGEVEGKAVKICLLQNVTEIRPNPFENEIRFMKEEELEANGNLIAAAPELLLALQNLVAHCRTGNEPWLVELQRTRIETAREVIARAKGERP